MFKPVHQTPAEIVGTLVEFGTSVELFAGPDTKVLDHSEFSKNCFKCNSHCKRVD